MRIRLSAPERRKQLLAVAVGEFGVRGYHITTMNQLAEAAGVTKPVLYQHFPSKRDLYLAVLGDVGERLRKAIADATGRASSPHAQVESGFSAYFGFFANEPAAFQVLFGDAARNDDEFAAVSHRVETELADTIAELMTIGTDADADADDRTLLAFGIVGLAEGSSRYWVARGLDIDPARLATRMADLVWYGLRGAPRH